MAQTWEIIKLPMNRSRPKRSNNADKMMEESMAEQYVVINLHIQAMFTAWCVKEAELQRFTT